MKAVKNFLMSYIKLCYIYVKFDEPIKVAHLQKLANQSMLNGALRNGTEAAHLEMVQKQPIRGVLSKRCSENT